MKKRTKKVKNSESERKKTHKKQNFKEAKSFGKVQLSVLLLMIVGSIFLVFLNMN